MRFFTRDLYRRCRSTDDDILSSACVEWEEANERYEQHLRTLEPLLPPHLRQFNDLLLHDARVELMARSDGRLLLMLRKDIPPRDLVVLSYDLADEPTVEPYAESPGDWSGQTDFQFDELELEQAEGGTVYTQSIVFGNGWLLRLRFRDVQVTVAHPVYPVHDVGAMPLFTLSGTA